MAAICFVCLVSARLPRSLVRTPTNLLERRTAYDCFSVSPVRSTQPQGRTDEGEAPRVSHKARFARRRDPPSLATRGRGRPRSRGVVQTAQRRAASQIKNPACPFSASSFFLRVLSLPLLLSEASTHNDARTRHTHVSLCPPTRHPVWKPPHVSESVRSAMLVRLTRARLSPAFSTTSSSRTSSDLSISTTPQISHGSQR